MYFFTKLSLTGKDSINIKISLLHFAISQQEKEILN